jgi:hypothetical protein
VLQPAPVMTRMFLWVVRNSTSCVSCAAVMGGAAGAAAARLGGLPASVPCADGLLEGCWLLEGILGRARGSAWLLLPGSTEGG